MAKVKITSQKRKHPSGNVAKKSARYIKTAQDVVPPKTFHNRPIIAKKSGVVAKIQSKKIQKYKSIRFQEYSIPRKNFQTLVRDIAQEYIQDTRFQKEALLALQEAAEDFMIGYFADANKVCNHAKRVTVMHKDMLLVQQLRKVDYNLKL